MRVHKPSNVLQSTRNIWDKQTGVHTHHLNCLGPKRPMGKDLLQARLEPGHDQTCLMNQNEEKASKEAGLEGEITGQGELGFFLSVLNPISGHKLHISPRAVIGVPLPSPARLL